MTNKDAAIAVTRFGLGARPGEIAAAASDPRGWLLKQIRPDAALLAANGLWSTLKGRQHRAWVEHKLLAEHARNPQKTRKPTPLDISQRARRDAQAALAREIEARNRHAVATSAPFAERWARFWSNHFTVSTRNGGVFGIVGAFEREAIRPRVFGRFEDLLVAVSLHAAMLVYLEANNSIGPGSVVGQRRGLGLNENFAREILELHTLGVGSGYNQNDIIELAKAMSGWTVAAVSDEHYAPGEVYFNRLHHEPGSRRVFGMVCKSQGADQAREILRQLAAHRATARHLAIKLARHFVADAPPPEAVLALERSFLESGGELAEVARAVVDLDAAWAAAQGKFKTPDELLVSAGRALGFETVFIGPGSKGHQLLAQSSFSAPSPAGWPDTADAWIGPDAVTKRLAWANAVARRAGRKHLPDEFVDQALGSLANAVLRKSIGQAESVEQGLTLALMSPAFQRR